MADIVPNKPLAIEVQGLKKSFHSHAGPVEALKGVSFNVPRGGVFCILGPNGAGKTTLLRILTTMLRPSEGTAKIDGFEVGRQNLPIRTNIGIVAQDNHFDRYLNVWRNLMLHAEMHGLSRQARQQRVTELLNQVGLFHRRYDAIDEFSGGMQRRVALIRALIHKPTVLFLDEPTTGLDPEARRDLWATIEAIKHETTVILTTHYMDEADRLSDRILILDKGLVTMEGTAAELKRRIAPPDTYELRLNTMTAEVYRERLKGYITDAEVLDGDLLRFRLTEKSDWTQLASAIDQPDWRSLGLAETDLETVYLTVAGRGANANAPMPNSQALLKPGDNI